MIRQELQEIRRRPGGIRIEALPDPPDEGGKDVFRLEKPGVPDDDHLASGQEGRGDEGFAEAVDILAFAVRHEEIEFPVLRIGNEELVVIFSRASRRRNSSSPQRR